MLGKRRDAASGQVRSRKSDLHSTSEKIGEPPDDVTCPENLDAEVGASITCILTEQGTEYDVTATVTSVDGESANFDIKVADVPNN